MFVLIILGLAVLYRFGPSRRVAKWRWISVGSVFAGLAWLAVSSLFSWYLGNFANYNATYGALGAVVGLMMWMWLSTIVVLVEVLGPVSYWPIRPCWYMTDGWPHFRRPQFVGLQISS